MSTSLPVSYGNWFAASGRRVETFTEKEARRKYDKMQNVDVLFGDPDHPDIVVQFSSGRMGTTVLFLDDLGRKEMEYFFTPPHKDLEYFLPDPGTGKIILQDLRVIEYLDRVAPPAEGEYNGMLLRFRPNGIVFVRSKQNGEDFEGKTVIPEEDRARIMEETYPRFGEWDSLIRRDREIPTL